MSNPNRETLLKEFVLYSRLLKEHERSVKEREISSTALQLHKISSSKQIPFHANNIDKNAGKLKPSYNQKYLFQNPDNSKRTVVYNQNQNFYEKYIMSKNQPPNFTSTVTKSASKSNLRTTNLVNASKNSVPASFNGSQDPNFKTKEFLKEVESVTALLKKKTAESQSRKLNSVQKCDSVAQGKLLSKKNSFDKPNFIDSKSVLLKAKYLSKIIPEKSCISNSSDSKVKIMNSYPKVNPRIKISPLHTKTNIQSKYCYKKIDNKQTLNVLSNNTSLRVIKDANQFQKINPLPHSNKSNISDCKKLLNASVNSSKSLGKQALIIKQSSANPSVFATSKSNAKSPFKARSPSLLKFKASNLHKSPKVTKTKTANTKYTKINKNLTTPNKPFLLKSAVCHNTPLSRNLKGKLGNKYKVINKSHMQSVQKKKLNSLVCKDDPILSVDDPILKNSDHSAIDKLEKNLMAISTALTADPFSEVNEGDNKMQQNSISKASFKSSLKRSSSLKKSKTRISKYKIVNSNVSQNDLLRRKRKLIHLNSPTSKIKHSQFSLINRKMQPVCVATPVKKEKAVLVRRLFKSKNAIVNKNVTPICNSAKLIKSKYLTLNKRKLPSWMKQSPYPKVPPQLTKFKGYSLTAKFHAKRIGYQKAIMHHPGMSRKFTSYGSRALNRHFNRKTKTKKYVRNANNRYAHRPVVLIHGMRYSMNASGKTLKKLPIKGQSTKLFRRINGKLPSSYESSSKILTSTSTNLASRVLNRSINRILTASSKKKLTKVNTYCMFYNRFGRCNRGIKCTYIHDPSKIAVCTRFLRGTCKVDGCPFSHEVAPGKMAICSLFLIGVCEKENCPYRHEKLSHDAVLCKAFVQGYCPNGKECKKAHILICPKYMQGECDKGSSCDFPHPPQKARKTVQKDVDDEEKKMDDVLLEKVFRYFQQSDNNSSNPENKFDENNTANMFVPKQKKLEEQPSFIPLCTTPET